MEQATCLSLLCPGDRPGVGGGGSISQELKLGQSLGESTSQRSLDQRPSSCPQGISWVPESALAPGCPPKLHLVP